MKSSLNNNYNNNRKTLINKIELISCFWLIVQQWWLTALIECNNDNTNTNNNQNQNQNHQNHNQNTNNRNNQNQNHHNNKSPAALMFNTNGFDHLFQWDPIYYENYIQTLNTIQRIHNTSATLHLIDIVNNFTNDELNKCKRIALNLLNFTFKPNAYEQFETEADIAIRTSHFLTNLFSFKNIRENVSLHYLITNKDFYWSLLLANLQSNGRIFGAGLTFSNEFLNDLLPNFKHFTPYIYRNVQSNNENDTIRTNLFNHRQSILEQEQKQSKQPIKSDQRSNDGKWPYTNAIIQTIVND